MALARISGRTDPSTAAFDGDTLVKIASSAAARPARKPAGEGASSAMAAIGAAIALGHARAIRAREPIGQEAAERGAEEPCPDRDVPEYLVAAREREAEPAAEERRRPRAEAAEREGLRDVAEDGVAVARVAEELAVHGRAAGALVAGGVELARRLRDQERHGREQDARAARDVERRAPAEGGLEDPTEHVSERRADGDRRVEDRQIAVLRPLVGDVVDDRRAQRGVARLADTDGDAREEHRPEAVRHPRDHGRDRPQRDARRDELLAGVPVAEAPEDRARQHVADHERRLDRAEGGVAQVELVLEPRADRHHEEAVDVVDEVERREQREDEGSPPDHGPEAT